MISVAAVGSVRKRHTGFLLLLSLLCLLAVLWMVRIEMKKFFFAFLLVGSRDYATGIFNEHVALKNFVDPFMRSCNATFEL